MADIALGAFYMAAILFCGVVMAMLVVGSWGSW